MPDRRRVAGTMLAVWLVALVIGWVNACVVRPAEAAHAPAREAVPAAAAAHDPGAVADHGHDLEAAPQACASACDGVEQALLKADPPKVAHLTDLAAAPLPFASPWLPSTPTAAHARRISGASPPPRLPVAIAFLRLTL